MARPRKDAPIDFRVAHELSKPLIDRLNCPPGVPKAFLRDKEVAGLRVRVTAKGVKAFVFEAKLNGKAISRTLGRVDLMTIEKAKAEARKLGQIVKTDKADPRELERIAAAVAVAEAAQKSAAEAAARAEADARAAAVAAQAASDALTVGEAWARYVAERRPRWGDRNYLDHLQLAQLGGTARERGEGLTKPGPLAPLLKLRLIDLDAAAVEAWATREAAERPARVRLALRLLKAFLRWAATEPDLKGRADPAAASAKKAREAAGKAKPKNDCLQREQLGPWFDSVRGTQNQVIAAYLQCLLLTGARREELAGLRWEDVNTQWRGISMKDKIEDRREVPLTPYVAHLLAGLPRRNQWVFSSTRSIALDRSNAERRARYHAKQGTEAPAGDVAAGLDGLTLHGLRRSFASLCEWLDIPGGISAQIQGHAPQGVREQNYIRRPLELLRVHHEKIESWILEQAEINFDPKAANVGPRLLGAA
jgi:integrase